MGGCRLLSQQLKFCPSLRTLEIHVNLHTAVSGEPPAPGRCERLPIDRSEDFFRISKLARILHIASLLWERGQDRPAREVYTNAPFRQFALCSKGASAGDVQVCMSFAQQQQLSVIPCPKGFCRLKNVSAAHAFTFRKVHTHVKSLPSKYETHPHKVRPPKYGKLCMRYRRIRRALDVLIGYFVRDKTMFASGAGSAPTAAAVGAIENATQTAASPERLREQRSRTLMFL